MVFFRNYVCGNLSVAMTRRLILMVALVVGLAAPAWAGWDEGVAAYDRGDYETALREFRPLAEQGNARAQNRLGLMYDWGSGVPRDRAEAAKWYRKAAEDRRNWRPRRPPSIPAPPPKLGPLDRARSCSPRSWP